MLVARTVRSLFSSVRRIPTPRHRCLVTQVDGDSTHNLKGGRARAERTDASTKERPKGSPSLGKSDLPVPPRIKGWPTPWIDKSSFDKYMQPLYDRGWGIRFMPRSRKEPRTLGLSAGYRLKGWNQTMKFLTEFNTLCRREKHHPVSFSIYNHPTHADIKIMIQTHSAVRPARFGRDVEDAAEGNKPITLFDLLTGEDRLELPGPTLRDVRLAALIHNLWEDEATSPTTDQSSMSHEEWMRMLQKLMGDPLEPTKGSPPADIPMAFNPNSTRGGLWTPASMQPSWAQLLLELKRCNGRPVSSNFNWAIGSSSLEQRGAEEDKETSKSQKRRDYYRKGKSQK